MSNLGLSAVEQVALRAWLLKAIDSACIEDWEFDSLVGSSRRQARNWVDSWLPDDTLDESRLDQVITMLSILAGSAQLDQVGSFSSSALDLMIEKLFWSTDEVRSTRADHQSSVTLRAGVQAPSVATPSKPTRKRGAAAR